MSMTQEQRERIRAQRSMRGCDAFDVHVTPDGRIQAEYRDEHRHIHGELKK